MTITHPQRHSLLLHTTCAPIITALPIRCLNVRVLFALHTPVDLHEIEAWRSQTAASSPLLFIHDSCHDIDFLSDTGASYSIIPSHVINNLKSFNTGTYHVSTISGDTLKISGQLKTQINFGFSQLFHYDFVIAALPYGIIGADSLCVDLNACTLFKSHDKEKFVSPIDEGVTTKFTIESLQASNTSILEKVKSQFLQVFEHASCCRKINTLLLLMLKQTLKCRFGLALND